jgi:hypothetical protein
MRGTSSWTRRAVGLAVAAATCAQPARVHAGPEPGVAWFATQLVPSPSWGGDRRERSFGLRWQLTPVLWSWGIHHRAPSRTRFFVVEPSYRHTGAIELAVEPEWRARTAGGPFLARAGVRAYFPIFERGEGLSVSTAALYAVDRDGLAPGVAVGLHALFGLIGIELAHAPGLAAAEWSITAKVRVL